VLPEDGYSKYMYLGQLSIGTQAVRYFEKGIAIMEKELSLNDDAELRRQISSALCSLTEMYMTDLWCVDAVVKLTTGVSDEQDAESRCEAYCNRAIQLDPTNAETLQTLASVRISQSRPDEAIKLLHDAINLNSEAEFGMKITLARMLLELRQWESAHAVLDGLMKMDDACMDVWYLFGWYYHLLGEEADASERIELWMEAREALLMVMKVPSFLLFSNYGM
jgi:predicted Zn-dependent protease